MSIHEALILQYLRQTIGDDFIELDLLYKTVLSLDFWPRCVAMKQIIHIHCWQKTIKIMNVQWKSTLYRLYTVTYTW